MPSLPIDDLLPDVLDAVRRERRLVLVAPTGSGKTTRVPPALLGAEPGRILVVQPRRVAARLAARWMASERREAVGETVGYRVRFDTRVSRRTRIEVVTEGVLLRRLLADPFLEDVSAVVLDEFHERSLDADLGLALLRQLRSMGREDLAVVVMSATLDPAPIGAFLGGAPVVRGEGRAFPVTVRHDPRPSRTPPTRRVPAAVRQVLAEEPEGHVLAFLAGVRDIGRCAEALGDLDVPVYPLHGRLHPRDQDRALAPSSRRKVVLATNLAETSVTLDGVRAVVDAGEAKVASFDPALGLTRLERRPISRASADQRAGRAGRTGPGLCLRLWTEAEHRDRLAAEVPEIRRADLAETVLSLLVWGMTPERLAWFEAPDPAAVERARRLLHTLGALEDGELTELGRTLARLPVHPRLGRVLVAGHRAGFCTAAAAVAALSEERDPFEDPTALPVAEGDLVARLEALQTPGLHGAHRGRLRRVEQVRDQLVRVARGALGDPGDDRLPDEAELSRALIAGFPDRVARHRGGGRYLLAEGGGAVLDEHSKAAGAPCLVALSLYVGRRREHADARIHLATPVDPDDLPARDVVELRFDAERQAVVQRRVRRYGRLVLDDRPAHDAEADPDEVARLLAEAARRDPDAALDRTEAVDRLLARVALLREHLPELGWPDLDPVELLPALCSGRRSFAELRAVDLAGALGGRLDWKQRRALEEHAPERMVVPSGASVRLRYEVGRPPVLAARIQQLFGLRETPRVARDRAPVLVELLGPNMRPVQITDDLAGFWERTYPEVRKQLRGRYPKHAWPERPTRADAEDRPRRR